MSRLLTTLVVEDEHESLQSLIRELERHVDLIKVSAIAESYAEAKEIILRNKFDISILDINLDEGYTCFNLMENANIKNFGMVVLNSKFPNIPLDKLWLFKKVPMHLDKPYTRTNIDDFRKRLNEVEFTEGNKVLILDCGNDGHIKINEDEILYIEAEGKYSVYHLVHHVNTREKIMIRESLSDQESKVSPTKFMRVQKSYIVNISKIVKLGKGDTRTSGKVIFENGIEAEYSKTNEVAIEEAMKLYN